jgi:hypothetical protein
MSAPFPKNEKKRIAVLWQYDVLDTVPETMFDDLTELAASICEVPIALISLVDEDRQWFKSKVGLTVKQTTRDISFCAHAILQKNFSLCRTPPKTFASKIIRWSLACEKSVFMPAFP